MLVFADFEPTPRLFLKFSLSPTEGQYLAGEFAGLTGLRQVLPRHLIQTVPVAFDKFELDGSVVTATGYLRGDRLVVPTLTARGNPVARKIMDWFWKEAIAWSTAVGQASAQEEIHDEAVLVETVERYTNELDHDQRTRQVLNSFSNALRRSRIRWRPVWQHGDITVGNALRHRRRLHLVDFEATASSFPPWFDATSLPAAAVVLASRQIPQEPLIDTAGRVLASQTWAGRLLQSHLEPAWQHQLPLGWAVAVTTMEMSLQRIRASQEAWRPYQELATALVCGGPLRSSAAWLKCEW